MKNRKGGFPRFRLALLVSGLLLGMNGTALAASSCKGLSQSKCDKSPDCSWVSSYQTKSGVKVDAYCRGKSSKSSGAGEAKKSDKAKQAQSSSTTKKEQKEKQGKQEKKPKKEKPSSE